MVLADLVLELAGDAWRWLMLAEVKCWLTLAGARSWAMVTSSAKWLDQMTRLSYLVLFNWYYLVFAAICW